MGKDRHTYLVNRDNLGGISQPVASAQVGNATILQAAVTYRTQQGTYVAFHAEGANLSAFRITASNPPTIDIANGCSVNQNGRGSPFVTSTDGTNNMIVWIVGADVGGDQRLHGFDGGTGNIVYAGGGPNELMEGTHRFNAGIAARGRIYIANDNKVYAFVVPAPTAHAHTYVDSKSYSDTATSSKPAASPDARALARLREKIGCLGFAPMSPGFSSYLHPRSAASPRSKRPRATHEQAAEQR
jgi:hypothetical protein